MRNQGFASYWHFFKGSVGKFTDFSSSPVALSGAHLRFQAYNAAGPATAEKVQILRLCWDPHPPNGRCRTNLEGQWLWNWISKFGHGWTLLEQAQQWIVRCGKVTSQQEMDRQLNCNPCFKRGTTRFQYIPAIASINTVYCWNSMCRNLTESYLETTSRMGSRSPQNWTLNSFMVNL
jgi:hypothetical protein